MDAERDYVLGTNDEEIQRLGLQHRVWRPVVLACWQNAGITIGSKVIDIGAGPGYATIDLAEIVGDTGEVTAVERSAKFVRSMKARCEQRGLAQVKVHELDLMTGDLPGGGYDFSWCRWVTSFVSDPAVLIRKIAKVLRPGGRAIFHEYGHYRTWQFCPPLPIHDQFVDQVVQSWSESGGKADIGLEIPRLLLENGFAVESIEPRVFCITPNDYMWQWPASFLQSGPIRLQELGKIDQVFVDKMQEAMAAATANPDSRMITPLVLEIVAHRQGAT